MKKIALLFFAICMLTSCGKGKKSTQKTTAQDNAEQVETTTPKETPKTVNNTPWTAEQLMPADVLVQKIKTNQLDSTLLLSIGFEGVIKGSTDLGPASEATGLNNLKTYLAKVPKDKSIVIYCGCCPMDVCPNIRPAFALLNKMGFTNAKLLQIPTSIKADWLDKGYPSK